MEQEADRYAVRLFGASVVMDTMQRIISKHQHSDGLIGLWTNHQMLEDVSYDFSKYQRHGTHYGVTNRFRMARSNGHYMNMSGYNSKAASYTDIHSAGLANDNLIKNPGLEDAGGGTPELFEHWLDTPADGAITSDAGVFRTGAASAKLVRAANPCWIKAANFYATAGEVYEVTYWAYGDGVNESFHGVTSMGGPTPVEKTGNGVTAAAWTKVTFQFTGAVGETIARLYLHSPEVNGGFCYFDDIDVRGPGGFKGSTGSAIAHLRISDGDVWTDVQTRYALALLADADNHILFRKDAANNTVSTSYKAGGVLETFVHTPITTTTLFSMGMTWDISAGADGVVKHYIDGALKNTDTALGTWIGDLLDTATVLGAYTTEPAHGWNGGIGLVGLYNEVKTDDEMLKLSTP